MIQVSVALVPSMCNVQRVICTLVRGVTSNLASARAVSTILICLPSICSRKHPICGVDSSSTLIAAILDAGPTNPLRCFACYANTKHHGLPTWNVCLLVHFRLYFVIFHFCPNYLGGSSASSTHPPPSVLPPSHCARALTAAAAPSCTGSLYSMPCAEIKGMARAQISHDPLPWCS